jgi:protein-glutamine gamma-glutamyltransferase
MGEILENSDPVMEVRLRHEEPPREFTESEYAEYLGPDPLFRGAVLDLYESGRWQRLHTAEPAAVSRFRTSGPIVQQVRLEPIGTSTLFSFGNAIAVQPSGDGETRIVQDLYSNEFLRSEVTRGNEVFQYRVFADEGPPDTYAARQRSRWSTGRRLAFGQYLLALAEPPENLDRVRRLARSVVEGAHADRERADQILAYLADSRRFAYSLKLTVQDAKADPVEDFLFNRQEGHCEYFASSMVMLLRSLGIPARLVSGFKGGTYDRGRKVFIDQQLHAHTWVEAFIDGRWLTYDPTPEARNEAVSALLG